MKECNICTNRGCRLIDKFRKGKIHLTRQELQSSCASYKPAKRLKATVLEFAFANYPEDTVKFLVKIYSALRLKFVETTYRPYFKFEVANG